MMNKRIYLLINCILFAFASLGQVNRAPGPKPAITPAEFGKFTSVTGANLSNDGKYVMYNIYDPYGNNGGAFVKEIHGQWKSDRLSFGQFMIDSRHFIYKSSKDSLAILDLQNKTTEYIPGAVNYKQGGKWASWLLKPANKLIVRNIENKKEGAFNEVSDFYFNKGGTSLLLISTVDTGLQALQWIHLESEKKIIIWTAENKNTKASGFVFSKTGNELAFVVETKGGKAIWVYKGGSEKAIEVASMQILSDNDLFIDGIDYRGFTANCESLFISIKEKARKKPGSSEMASFDLWSYTDVKLQSQQLKQLNPKTYVGLLNIEDGKIVRLEELDQTILSVSNRHALIANLPGLGIYDDWYWNAANASAVYLVSLEDGSRKLLQEALPYTIASRYLFSPEGKYVLYYDAEREDYFSYDIKTGVRKNITKGITGVWTEYSKRDIPMGKYMPIYSGGAGGVKNDEAVFLYDQCDVYQVFLSGEKAAINLTAGYGRANNIEFRFAIENEKQLFKAGDKVVLSAFNRENKQDGFYSITIGKSELPKLLTTGDYVYKGTWEDERFNPVYPTKAINASVYLVRRMTATESPNYFWTKDFKTFHPVSDVHPEENYNWVTSELVSWKLPNGKSGQGVLYKPENFDASKKYPLLINYYERKTEAKNVFIMPEVSHGEINIPYMVSNGYLVFTPDIYFQPGHTGESVLNTISSAADYLSTFSFVDAKHIGIQGHSRGGWQTNFLITHSNKFAAAVSAAGWCNYITQYNGVRLLSSGVSRQTTYENVYQRQGATLWQKPDLFIENSPIFKADKVTTPILMFANKEDNDVPFEQGIEFFTALRRLGKKAWMFQYDGERHVLFDKAAMDFSIRMKQFFDHYLKGEPAPKWMLNGIPASQKGIEDGLELVKEKDANGNWITPGSGLLKTNQ